MVDWKIKKEGERSQTDIAIAKKYWLVLLFREIIQNAYKNPK